MNHAQLGVSGLALMTLLTLIATVPLPAHPQQSFAATYDSERQVTLEGPVTKIDWVNPRAFLYMNVSDAAGIITNWAVEFGNPIDLARDGWKANSLRIGDIVKVEGIPARGAQKHQAFAKTVVAAATGKRLFVPPARRAAAPAAPAPRWPNGRVRLGPPQGKKGYWNGATVNSLVQSTAAKIPMNEDGLLLNIADADRVAPFQPWAKDLYVLRQRSLLKDDPYARCIPPGGPRQFQMPNGFQFVEQPEIGRILVLLGGGDRNWRVINTDGRPASQAAEAVLSYYGTSVGRWEKDTLVVESVGFNERFWFSKGGLPHTEALRLTERFTRTDLNTLRYEVTVNDPRTYTKPWTAAWNMQWVPDQDIEEYFCEEKIEALER